MKALRFLPNGYTPEQLWTILLLFFGIFDSADPPPRRTKPYTPK